MISGANSKKLVGASTQSDMQLRKGWPVYGVIEVEGIDQRLIMTSLLTP